MAEARNYEEYRRQVLDNLGVEYLTEDIEDFVRWKKKVLSGLKDLYSEENIVKAIYDWLDEHPEYYKVDTENIVDEAVTIPKLGNDVINKIENIPLASGTKVGGIKFGMAGEPPRPSARLTSNWTPSYPNVSDVKFPLIRDDGTISAYFIPDATQTVKGAMTAEDKTKLDGLSAYKREVIKTVTSDENLHNTTRGVYIWFDGDVIPDVNVYYEMTTYALKYDIVEVYKNITNDHPEYGSNKVLLWIYPNRFDSSTQIQAGGSFVVEHNGNKAEGGDIVH